MKPDAQADREERLARAANTRTLILVGALTTMLGIALAVGDNEGFGGWLTLLGLLASVAALHRYGRLGSDGPSDRLARPPED